MVKPHVAPKQRVYIKRQIKKIKSWYLSVGLCKLFKEIVIKLPFKKRELFLENIKSLIVS